VRPQSPLKLVLRGQKGEAVDETCSRTSSVRPFSLKPAHSAELGRDAPRVKAVVLESDDIARAIKRIAHEVLERNKGAKELVLVGIRKRGVPIAERLGQEIERIEGTPLPVGALDISFYRDDIDIRNPNEIASTEFPFDVEGKTVVLVDDVLFTGRTVRAAIDALVDFGRPRSVQLAVLVDRGHRELPIRADYVGKNIPTAGREEVLVMLAETDGSDSVVISEAL
jgi:pyrimidine operon attenuation protein / uracil phosphoribosyltransferase